MSKFEEFKNSIINKFRKTAKSSYDDEHVGTGTIENGPYGNYGYTINGEHQGHSSFMEENGGSGYVDKGPYAEPPLYIYDGKSGEYKRIGAEAWLDENRGTGRQSTTVNDAKQPLYIFNSSTGTYERISHSEAMERFGGSGSNATDGYSNYGHDYFNPLTGQTIHTSYSALVEHGYEVTEPQGPYLDPNANIDMADPKGQALAKVSSQMFNLLQQCKEYAECENRHIATLQDYAKEIESKLQFAADHGVESNIQYRQREELKIVKQQIDLTTASRDFASNIYKQVQGLENNIKITSYYLKLQDALKHRESIANAIVNDPNEEEKNRLLEEKKTLEQSLSTFKMQAQPLQFEDIIQHIQGIRNQINTHYKSVDPSDKVVVEHHQNIARMLDEISMSANIQTQKASQESNLDTEDPSMDM